MQLTRRLDENHDMTFGQGLQNFATGPESVRIAVETRLLVLLGEWFLDTTAGLPYLGRITAKPVDLSYTEAQIKACILGTDEVAGINSFQLSYDQKQRVASVQAQVVTTYDETVTVGVSA